MIDLHTHILPNLDDGAPDLDCAVAMCRQAQRQGCRSMVATPHWRHPQFQTPSRDEARQLLSRLQSEVGTGIKLLLGAELRVDAELVEDLLIAGAHELPALGTSRALLLEFSHEPVGHDPAAVVHELVVAGFRPVLAHPELIPWMAEDLDLLRRLVRLGALAQITADSLLGRYGMRTRSLTRSLVDHGVAHVVASDCHDLERRPPCLEQARQEISRRWNAPLATAMVSSNPLAILAGRPLRRAA